MGRITVAEVRALSGSWDPDDGQRVHRGLDLTRPTEITPAEPDTASG